jgi:uncharacterized protein (DUF486 family)
MAEKMTEEEMQKVARQRVEAKKGFFIHLLMYVVINAFLVFIWWMTTGGNDYPWFLWVIGGWGIGVIANAIAVFVGPKHGSEWEAREMDKEMENLKKRNQ